MARIGIRARFFERQLFLPLCTPVFFKNRRGRPKGSRTQKEGNSEVWSDEAVIKIADAVIQDALSSLNNAQTTLEERSEIIEWVSVPIRDVPAPTSFQSYAMLAGLDAESLRDQLMLIIKKDQLNAASQQVVEIDPSFTKDNIIEAILFGIEVESRERKTASKTNAATLAA
jgi:hypothetical protein